MSNQIKLRAWAKRYKLLHVFFWTLITMINAYMYYDPEIPLWASVLDNFILVFIGFVPFYTTAYFLVPHYLYKYKYRKFFVRVLFMAVFMSLTYLGYNYISYYIFHNDTFYQNRYANGVLKFLQHFFVVFWTYMIPLLCASTVKVMSDRFRSETKLNQIKQEKLSTELNFLRSQINPHFLFNVMNTIYFQISKENTDARNLVETISEMLRYQLYECNVDKIAVEKEINYLKNYVSIRHLRSNSNGDIQLLFDPAVQGFEIAPLLLQPLVENAIKYADQWTDNKNNTMQILMELSGPSQMTTTISNHNEVMANDLDSYVTEDAELGSFQRRIEMLYPDKYTFAYSKDKYLYYSKLTINYE